MDIYEPLPKKKQDDQFVEAMTDRNTKLLKAIPTTKINYTTAVRILLEH